MFSVDRRRRTTNRLDFLRAKSTGSLETGERPSFWSGFWPRVIVVILAGLAATAILAVGGPPFTYRLGQRAHREIRLAVPLQIENVTETRNARERAAREAPWVFSHNPQPIEKVEEGMHALAEGIGKAKSFDELNSVMANEWGLTPELFTKMRELIPSEAGAITFNKSIDRVLDPFVRYGLLDSARIPTDAKRETSLIEVRPVGSNVKYLPKLDAVYLPLLPQEDGALSKSLRQEFKEGAVTVLKVLVPKLQPTLTFDEQETKEVQRQAMGAVEPIVDEYAVNSLVVELNSEIGQEQLRLLQDEHRELLAQQSWNSWAFYRRLFGLLTLVGVVTLLASFYLIVTESVIVKSFRQIVVLSGIFLATLALARIFSIEPYRAELVPLAVCSFYLAISYNRQMASVMAVGLSILIAVCQPQPMEELAVLAGGTVAGVLLLDSVRSRTKPILVGLVAGLVYAAIEIGVGLLLDKTMTLLFLDAVRLFGCGLIAGFVMSGSLPFVESLFGIVTDISLIELADSSHPLLQDLIRRAPGTYNHSVSVSIIGEAAAKAIGCNSLLVRVGALFHDVGKMLKPQYFIENKGPDEVNRHEHIAPAISTLIIIGHVKDGMELAREHHLPLAIMDMIEQHHGTTLVDYFFHEATRELQSRPDPEEEVDEAAFRYPGPKPQTKEAAVMMLSDCVESASRALSDPTPARIEKLVHNLTLNRLLDGQFDECGITLQEIQAIEQSLKKSLTAVYHGRIKYPAAV
jgi:putative nucleotidyltransferase with HDIG domain